MFGQGILKQTGERSTTEARKPARCYDGEDVTSTTPAAQEEVAPQPSLSLEQELPAQLSISLDEKLARQLQLELEQEEFARELEKELTDEGNSQLASGTTVYWINTVLLDN